MRDETSASRSLHLAIQVPSQRPGESHCLTGPAYPLVRVRVTGSQVGARGRARGRAATGAGQQRARATGNGQQRATGSRQQRAAGNNGQWAAGNGPSTPRRKECRVTKRHSATWATQHSHAGSFLFLTSGSIITRLCTFRLSFRVGLRWRGTRHGLGGV